MLDHTSIVTALERILASESFARSKRLSAFLRFIVERALAGRNDDIKEYRIGSEVYERGPDFDPKMDNVVRVEANRLRAKLRDYYDGAGREDPIRIEIPKGAYLPVFSCIERKRPPIALRPALRYATIAIVTIAVAGAGGYWYAETHGFGAQPRRSIAVLGLRDATSGNGDSRWISTALSEMLTMDFAENSGIRTISAKTVEEMRRDLDLRPADVLPAAVLSQIRNRLGADLVVAGSYTVLHNLDAARVRLDLRVQSTAGGQTMAFSSFLGNLDDLSVMAARAGRELRTRIGMRPQEIEQSTMMAHPGSMKLYSEGLDELRAMNMVAARDLLERAVQADPSNPFAYAALAEALRALGYDQKARDAAQNAFGLAAHLRRVDQLEIEGRYRMYAGQWAEAIRIYSVLWRTTPDSIDDALSLVDSQLRATKLHDALATIASIRKVPDLSDDPNVDFAEAQVLGASGNFRRALDVARAAEKKAQIRGARLLYAHLRRFESGAMQVLGIGDPSAVRAEARQLCEQAGDGFCVLSTLRAEANHFCIIEPFKGRLLFEEALPIARTMGAMREATNLLEGLAATNNVLGDLRAAEKSLEEALRIEMDLGASQDETQLNIADIYTQQGRLRESAALIQRVIRSARETGQRETLANSLAEMATILRLQGKIDESVTRSREALSSARETGSVISLFQILIVDGDNLAAAGNFDAATARYMEARKLVAQIPAAVGQPELGLGEVLLRRGRAEEAEPLLRSAIQTSHSMGLMDEEIRARAALVEALVKQHKRSEALQEAAVVRSQAVKTQNPDVRLKARAAGSVT
ncbi:MAG TPA: tetratricopeptide repeat protein [Bryobacteraceae bacterium]|nr:tetratricopeptide repeat protein [Bryobacteraceae bacterium]